MRSPTRTRALPCAPRERAKGLDPLDGARRSSTWAARTYKASIHPQPCAHTPVCAVCVRALCVCAHAVRVCARRVCACPVTVKNTAGCTKWVLDHSITYRTCAP